MFNIQLNVYMPIISEGRIQHTAEIVRQLRRTLDEMETLNGKYNKIIMSDVYVSVFLCVRKENRNSQI